MDTHNRFCTWGSVLLGVIAVAALIWVAPTPEYKAGGILLPAQNVRTSISPQKVSVYLDSNALGNISIYTPSSAPAVYSVLGHISIEQHSVLVTNETEIAILEKAKQLAASVGANGVLVKVFYHPPEGVPPDQAKYLFQAEAIYSASALAADLGEDRS